MANDINLQLIDAAIAGDHEGIVRLIALGADPLHGESFALCCAAEHGHADCVKLLIPVSDAKADYSDALRRASEHGHAECVKLLIPASDPKADSSHALRLASLQGHAECVELLCSVSDPKAKKSLALLNAIASGHVECARLLAPVSDPLIGMPETVAWIASTHPQSADALPAILAYEPRLFEVLDFPAILAAATAKGYAKTALLISAIIEKKSLSTHLPSFAAGNALAPRRL